MNATRCLRDEHEVILKVLDCLEIALRNSQDTQRVTREEYGPFVEFLKGFADSCHHCKEENHLFPTAEKNGIPRDGGPIGVMLMEHEQARKHVGIIAENLEAADSGDDGAARTLLEHGQSYLALLRDHIDKENHCLFEMADKAIAGSDLAELTKAYKEAESTSDYRRTMTACRAIAERLIATYQVE